MKIKATLRVLLPPVRMGKINRANESLTGKNIKQGSILLSPVGMPIYTVIMKINMAVPQMRIDLSLTPKAYFRLPLGLLLNNVHCCFVHNSPKM